MNATLKRTGLQLFILILVLVIAGLVAYMFSARSPHSVEVHVAESSPNGASGGLVVPASCPSYAHSTGECTSNPNVSCSPASIAVGGAVTCTWQCDTANGDTSSAGTGFPTGGATSGSSAPLHPTGSGASYTVQCFPSNRYTSATVSVVSPVLSISASPTRVKSGSSATVTWSASDVTSCAIAGPGVAATGLSGSRSTGALTAQSTYVLTCQSSIGQQTASTTVSITPSFIEI